MITQRQVNKLITKQDIHEFLKNAGIRHDDKVTIHASLRSVGKIENGADGLIDAFCEYYPNYKEAFDYAGAVTYSKLGNALIYICDCRKMTDICRIMWERADYDLCVSAKPIPRKMYEDTKL